MAKFGLPQNNEELALFCAKIAEEKIASDILLMNMEKIETAPAEYFVIATCDSDMQMRAVVDLLKDVCREIGMEKPRIEGTENMKWVLIDYFHVVMHLMLPDVRDYYHLEKLWGDADFTHINTDHHALTY